MLIKHVSGSDGFHFLFREQELVERAKELKVNAGTEPGTDIGPVISREV